MSLSIEDYKKMLIENEEYLSHISDVVSNKKFLFRREKEMYIDEYCHIREIVSNIKAEIQWAAIEAQSKETQEEIRKFFKSL